MAPPCEVLTSARSSPGCEGGALLISSLGHRPVTSRSRIARVLSLFVAIASIAAIARLVLFGGGSSFDEGPYLYGPPVRTAADGTDGVFALTFMTHRSSLIGGRSMTARRTSSIDYIDLWRFDPATGTPVWRRRIASGKGALLQDPWVLGVAGGKLWYGLDGLRASSLTDGRTAFDTTMLFTRAPALRTTFPRRDTQWRLDTLGVHLRGADGRGWRIDPVTLQVAEEPSRGPWEDPYTAQFRPRTPDAEQRRGVTYPAVVYPSSPNGYKLNNVWWPGRWVGLSTDERGDSMAAPDPERSRLAKRADGYMIDDLFSDYYFPEERVRLWGATVETDDGGTRRFGTLAPLSRSDRFLQGGLLHDASKLVGAARPRAITLSDPEAVLVLSRTRLDDADTLRLSRVTVADGATAWQHELPLSMIKGVMPAGRVLVLHGLRTDDQTASDVRRSRSGQNEAFVFVDLATGTVRQWLLDLDHPKMKPIED
jgi:hypothetical protein